MGESNQKGQTRLNPIRGGLGGIVGGLITRAVKYRLEINNDCPECGE